MLSDWITCFRKRLEGRSGFKGWAGFMFVGLKFGLVAIFELHRDLS